eukprot:1170877-Karenia_brevis.AAC.1
MGRAHFTNELHLAKFLINTYPLAAQHLSINNNGHRDIVLLREATRFSTIVSKHRHASMTIDISAQESRASNPKSSKAVIQRSRAK